MNLVAPAVGWSSDIISSRRPLKLAGILCCLVSYVMMLIGVQSDDYYLFAAGTVMDHLGVVFLITMLNVCCIDWGTSLRSTNVLSGINTLFQLIGAAVGYLVAGAAFPLKKSNGFFYVGIVVSSIQFLILLLLPSSNYELINPAKTYGTSPTKKALLSSKLTRTMEDTTIESDSNKNDSAGSDFPEMNTDYHSLLLKYRDLLIVTSVRFAFFMGIGALTNNLLYYIEDRIKSSEEPAMILSMCAIVALLFTMIALAPSIWVCGEIGTLKSVWISTVVLATLLVIYPWNTSLQVIYVLSAFLGSVQGLNAVSDLVLVGQCIPDEKDRARDIAFWSVSQSLGLAIGSAIFGSLLNYIGKTGHRSRDDGRVVYSFDGYLALFWTSAGILLISSFALFLVRNKTAYETSKGSGKS